MLTKLPRRSPRRVSSLLGFGIAALTIAAGVCAATDDDDSGATIHAVNLMIKSLLDESFCVQTDVAVSAPPRVFIAPCTGASGERWTFTDGADGFNVIVGDTARCLESGGQSQRKTLQIVTCDYHGNQRFGVDAIGRILEKGTNNCVTLYSPIVSGSPIFIEECQQALGRQQVWRFVQ
jgi:hypothetical protein